MAKAKQAKRGMAKPKAPPAREPGLSAAEREEAVGCLFMHIAAAFEQRLQELKDGTVLKSLDLKPSVTKIHAAARAALDELLKP